MSNTKRENNLGDKQIIIFQIIIFRCRVSILNSSLFYRTDETASKIEIPVSDCKIFDEFVAVQFGVRKRLLLGANMHKSIQSTRRISRNLKERDT